jgi:hypothetical protein
LGKTMFLFSACSTGIPLMASTSPPPATIISVVFICLLTPDILAPGYRIENALPTSSRVKDRHVEHEHRVVPPRSPTQRVPRFGAFCLPKVGCFHVSDSFQTVKATRASIPRRTPSNGLSITNQNERRRLAMGSHSFMAIRSALLALLAVSLTPVSPDSGERYFTKSEIIASLVPARLSPFPLPLTAFPLLSGFMFRSAHPFATSAPVARRSRARATE